LSKIIFASLEASIYVWLSTLNYSTEPKKARRGLFEGACRQKLKQVYPKKSHKDIKEMINHLIEYYIEVLKREL
jgi:hypothetical protein